MPSTSKKQHNFMAAIAHSPSFAKKVGVPQSVGQDFNKADKGRKFSKGGDTMATKMDPKMMAALMAKKKAARGAAPAAPAAVPPMGGMGGGMGMKKGGLAAGHKSANGIAKKGLTKGTQVTMKKGGKC